MAAEFYPLFGMAVAMVGVGVARSFLRRSAESRRQLQGLEASSWEDTRTVLRWSVVPSLLLPHLLMEKNAITYLLAAVGVVGVGSMIWGGAARQIADAIAWVVIVMAVFATLLICLCGAFLWWLFGGMAGIVV